MPSKREFLNIASIASTNLLSSVSIHYILSFNIYEMPYFYLEIIPHFILRTFYLLKEITPEYLLPSSLPPWLFISIK